MGGVMSLEYIRTAYGVPANVGQRVRYKGCDEGVIVGSHNSHIKVKMDKNSMAFSYHPTWEMEYLEAKCEK
jgi:hypothetical protein